mgnify:CR=1 FL=1
MLNSVSKNTPKEILNMDYSTHLETASAEAVDAMVRELL